MPAITFEPLYMERIWGGRSLETLYHRTLPDANRPYGEAWEISDREDAQSIVSSGDYQGLTLHQLWQEHRGEIFGDSLPDSPRFPLLIKILDAADDLSVQVHPPASIAARLGGEPKTEMWYIARADPGAKLYVGFRKGATREKFLQAIQTGDVAGQIHSIQPVAGDSIFIESGRLHAIGAGFLIHEIQQNSDTTYRVFDWNRKDPHGRPRELHIGESMACIDFRDIEPDMTSPVGNLLADCPFFQTTVHDLQPGERIGHAFPDRFSLMIVVRGCLENRHPQGCSLLLPRSAAALEASTSTRVLRITIPPQ